MFADLLQSQEVMSTEASLFAWPQVLDCTSSKEGCENTTESAFDQQKTAVVRGLFQLLISSAGRGTASIQVVGC